MYCDGRCDEMGCRGHDLLDFERYPHCADQDELLKALFSEVKRLRGLLKRNVKSSDAGGEGG